MGAEVEVLDLLATDLESKVLDELHVTAAVVADQHPIADEGKHFRHDLLDGWCVFEHLVVDARHLAHDGWNRDTRIDQRVVAIFDLAALIAEGTYLGDAVLQGIATCRLDVEDDVRP